MLTANVSELLYVIGAEYGLDAAEELAAELEWELEYVDQ